MLRRDLLKFAAAAPLAFHLRALADSKPRYLVLVELNGGNDGLNTVVPYADPNYLALRPRIGIARDQVLQLDQRSGLHPALQPLLPAWQERRLAIVQAVGYPEPNRSHFRSIEIWDTGSGADEYLDSGWLARALPGSGVTRGFIADAVVIGRNPRPVMGGAMRALVINDVEGFGKRGEHMAQIEKTTSNPALAHLLQVQNQVHAAAAELLDAARETPPPQAEFPPGAFSKALQQAARLIQMDHAVPVIKVSLGSFDTHAGQRGRQDRLLGELAAGLAAFRTALQNAGAWNRVLILTYSEFGRRATENASEGTDHGTAAAHFLIGGAVKGGLYGEPPDLAQLEDGDLKRLHDYRSIYNAVLKNWWALPQTPFDTRAYPPLRVV